MFKWLYKKKGCAKHMNNKLEVIGIDHGWSMMKTISQVFVTGVKEITTTPALFGDVLEYEGKFYKVGTVRQEVKDTKVEDDSFYLLTLAAVAKELKRRGLAEAKVFLAVGLPLTRFGAEKNDFIKYLTKNKRVKADMKSLLRSNDEWLRHRIRAIYWKQWKKVKTKFKELRKLGVEEEKAWICANMRNGNWYCSGYFVLQTAFNNKKLRELGYPTFTEFYLKICEK